MKKIKLLCVAFATALIMFSCDSKRQESSSGTGANEGMADERAENDGLDVDDAGNANDNLSNTADNAMSNTEDDAKELAEEANDERFESDSAEKHSDFLVEAAEGGLFEVEAARLAQQKAVSPKVKNFAKHMMDNHSQANKELKALAAKKNITIPSSLGEDKMEKIQELTKLSGNEFDEEYMEIMVKDHKEDVRLFDREAKDSDDNEVEKWAASILPKLQKHLEMAEQTQDELEKTNSNTARK